MKSMDRRMRSRRNNNAFDLGDSDGWVEWSRPGRKPPEGGATLWIGPFPLPHQKVLDKELLENILLTVHGVSRIKMHHQFAFVTLTDASVVPEVEFLVGKWRVRGGPVLRAEPRVWRTSFRRVHKSPLEIRFSQPVVSQTFRNEKTLDQTLQSVSIRSNSSISVSKVSEIVAPFRPIRVARKDGAWVTIDNRRLCVLQAKAMQCWPARTVTTMYEFKDITSEHLAKFDGNYSCLHGTDRRQVMIKDTRSDSGPCNADVTLRLWAWEDYASWAIDGVVSRHIYWIVLASSLASCVPLLLDDVRTISVSEGSDPRAPLSYSCYRAFMWPVALLCSYNGAISEPSFLRSALLDYSAHKSPFCQYSAYCALIFIALTVPVLFLHRQSPRLVMCTSIAVAIARFMLPTVPARTSSKRLQPVAIPSFGDLPVVRDPTVARDVAEPPDTESSDSNE